MVSVSRRIAFIAAKMRSLSSTITSAGWIAALHVIEHPLLVDVDEHEPFDRIPQSGALDLAQLKADPSRF